MNNITDRLCCLFFVLFGLMLISLFGFAFVGAVPGIGPVMAMAIAILFTFGLAALVAIGFLMGVNKGGLWAGRSPQS